MTNFKITLSAATPISHGDTVTGIDNSTNMRLFMRQGLVVNGIPQRVPTLSENAMRSVIWRNPLATHLFKALEIEHASLSKSVVNLFFSGGNLVAGAKAPSNDEELGRTVQATFPSLELLSGSVDNFILPPGRLRVALFPVAQEYAHILEHVAPEEVSNALGVSIFDLITEETRTRGTGGESDGNQMIYSYETLAAGTRFVCRVTLTPNASELCHSALGFALSQWDGYFGGQSRQGRGLMAIENSDLPNGNLYENYIKDNTEFLREALISGRFGTQIDLCKG